MLTNLIAIANSQPINISSNKIPEPALNSPQTIYHNLQQKEKR